MGGITTSNGLGDFGTVRSRDSRLLMLLYVKEDVRRMREPDVSVIDGGGTTSV
jgi:hypothetical protein